MGMGGDGTAGSTSWVIICAKCGRRRASMGNSSVLEAGLLEVSLTRRIAAAPEFVFRAWIDAKHLAEWWGPKGVTNPVYKADRSEEHTFGLHTHLPHVSRLLLAKRIVEIDLPHRLVFAPAAL